MYIEYDVEQVINMYVCMYIHMSVFVVLKTHLASDQL